MHETARQITINALKYDRQIRRSWHAGLIKASDDLLVAVGAFEQTVEHDDLGIIQAGTVSFEYFWTHRWYNVFRFAEPTGEFRNFYCNIAMPPAMDGDVLEFIDLDIDVVVWADGRREVLDMADFEQNAEVYGYPDDVRFNAMHSLEELIRSIDRQEFPFGEATDAIILDI